jgi:hypothetical protein
MTDIVGAAIHEGSWHEHVTLNVLDCDADVNPLFDRDWCSF